MPRPIPSRRLSRFSLRGEGAGGSSRDRRRLRRLRDRWGWPDLQRCRPHEPAFCLACGVRRCGDSLSDLCRGCFVELDNEEPRGDDFDDGERPGWDDLTGVDGDD